MRLRVRHQEEGVDEDVEEEGGEVVAGVVVGPEAELDRDDDGRVDQQDSAHAQHGCRDRTEDARKGWWGNRMEDVRKSGGSRGCENNRSKDVRILAKSGWRIIDVVTAYGMCG